MQAENSNLQSIKLSLHDSRYLLFEIFSLFRFVHLNPFINLVRPPGLSEPSCAWKKNN